MLLSAIDIALKGLVLFGVTDFRFDKMSVKAKTTVFKSLYGASALTLAEQWYDLGQAGLLTGKEKTSAGLTMFFAMHYFLWTYLPNGHVVSLQFNRCYNYMTGRHFWHWVKKIQALKEKKVKWLAELDAEDSAIFGSAVQELGAAGGCVGSRPNVAPTADAQPQRRASL